MRNKSSNINTFRQTKDSKYFSFNDKIKKKLVSYQDSPRTIDYMQVMKKYEHLIEKKPENGKNSNKINNNHYKTENNLIKKINSSNKKNLMNKNLYNNNTFNKENINSHNISNNRNDVLINFCKTDDSRENDLKYTYDDKNNKTSNIGVVKEIIFLDYENSKNKSYKNIRNCLNDKIELHNFFENNEEYKKNNISTKNTKKNISYNSQSFNNLNNV